MGRIDGLSRVIPFCSTREKDQSRQDKNSQAKSKLKRIQEVMVEGFQETDCHRVMLCFVTELKRYLVSHECKNPGDVISNDTGIFVSHLSLLCCCGLWSQSIEQDEIFRPLICYVIFGRGLCAKSFHSATNILHSCYPEKQ